MKQPLNFGEPLLPTSNWKYSYRRLEIFKPLCFAIGIFATASAYSEGDLVTHPLGEAPSTQSAEASVPANPQADDVAPTDQMQKQFNQQFGDGKLKACSMKYKLEGFSLVYKQYDGTGEITCRNGQKAQVRLSSKSIGFTIGYSAIEGDAYFTDVKYISELFGDYVSLGNHFGLKNSVDRQILTRGEISLVMMGKGNGFDIGFTIGDLSIKPR